MKPMLVKILDLSKTLNHNKEDLILERPMVFTKVPRPNEGVCEIQSQKNLKKPIKCMNDVDSNFKNQKLNKTNSKKEEIENER